MRIALLVAATGCYHYVPGSYSDFRPWAGQHVELPCLDMAVHVARSEQATGPIVAYAFGNRCDHDVTVDLAAARVVARDAKGRELQLAAFDPRHEIRPLDMPALLSGGEKIEYNGDFAERELVEVCVDVGAIDHSDAMQTRWICSGDRLEPAR